MTAPFDGQALTDDVRTWTKDGLNQDPSWSPDGRRIAYKRGPNDKADLYVLDLGTGKSRRVVENPERDAVPAWTPRERTAPVRKLPRGVGISRRTRRYASSSAFPLSGTDGKEGFAISPSGRVRLVSSGMPGPMVVDTVILRRYRPLAALGFSRRISSTAAK